MYGGKGCQIVAPDMSGSYMSVQLGSGRGKLPSTSGALGITVTVVILRHGRNLEVWPVPYLKRQGRTCNAF